MNQLTDAMPQGYAAGALPARVEFEGRFKRGLGADWICFGLFIVGLLAHIAIGGYMKSQQTLEIDDVNGGINLTASFQGELLACLTANGTVSGRRLQSVNQQCNDLWCVFARDLYIPATTIAMTPIIGAIWIAGMYFASQVMTWISILFNIAIYFMVGGALLAEGFDGALPYLFIGFGAILLILAGVTHKKIIRAGNHLRVSSLALSKNLSVFPATGVLELMTLGFLGWHWFCLITSAKVAYLDSDCNIIPYPPQIQRMVQFQSLYLVWVVAFLDSAKLVTTAMSIATWYFDQQDKPRLYPFHALKTSLTSSAGALSVGSLITAIVDGIVKKATEQFWWLSPWGCVMKCFFIMLQGCILSLTRYALVGHAFEGDAFFAASAKVFVIMKRNFVGAYVTDRVGVSIIRTGANALSLCIGLTAWFMIDKENGWDTLTDIVGFFDDSLFLVIVFILAFLWLIKHPLLTILLMTLIMDVIPNISSSISDDRVFAPFGGIFVACVASIILNFQGDVVLDSMSTIFMCFAVNQDHKIGKPSADDRGIVYALVLDTPEAKPVAEISPA